MVKVPDLSVVIPAYNEAARIEPTIREMVTFCVQQNRLFEVVVVDDGSRDQTSQVARSLCQEFPWVRLIRLPVNQGKGYAVRTGVLNAVGRRVLFADADGATPITEIERLEAALEAGADLSVGSRAFRAESVSIQAKAYRHLIGRTFHCLVEWLADAGVKDTQCGFKLFRSAVAQDLFSRTTINGFSFDVELLVLAKRLGYKVAEVPVSWSHQAGSKVRLASDPIRMAADLFRIRAQWLTGEYDRSHSAGRHHDIEAAVPLS